MTRLAAGPAVAALLLLSWPGRPDAEPGRGQLVFQRCYACHSVKPGEAGLPGPNLHGVIGRRAGTLPGFEFSPAMVEAGAKRPLVWTTKALDAFLSDPERFVPGTTMSMPPLHHARDRQDLLDFLEQAAGGTPGK